MKNFVFEVLDDLRAHDHRLVRAETEEEARARCEAGDEAARVRGDGDLVAVTNRGLGMKSSVHFTEKSVVIHLEKETPA